MLSYNEFCIILRWTHLNMSFFGFVYVSVHHNNYICPLVKTEKVYLFFCPSFSPPLLSRHIGESAPPIFVCVQIFGYNYKIENAILQGLGLVQVPWQNAGRKKQKKIPENQLL